LSRLPNETDHATLTGVALKQNQIKVSHTGLLSTRLFNQAGPLLRWRAEFPGTLAQLTVAGKLVPARHGLTHEGLAISWTDVNVESGAEVLIVALPSRTVLR
jgi:hypothetical protein